MTGAMMPDTPYDDLKARFPGGLAEQIAAMHKGEEERDKPAEESVSDENHAEDITDSVPPEKEPSRKESPPVNDRLADAIDKLSERLAGQSENKKESSVTPEAKKTLLEELAVELPDLGSEEIAKIFDDNGLSAEVKALFAAQQKAFASALNKIGERQAASAASAEEAKVSAGNLKFWGNLKRLVPDCDQYITPDGIHGQDAKLTKTVDDWLAGQPEFIAKSARKALLEGSDEEIASVISAIKKSSPDAGKAVIPDKVAKKIKDAEEATVKQPNSISAIPGTSVPPDAADEVEHASDKTEAARRYHGGSLKKMKELMQKVLTV